MALFGSRKAPDPTLQAKLQADLAIVREDPLPGYSPERVLARLQQAAAGASPPLALPRPSFVRSPRFWLLAATLTLLASAGVLVARRAAPPARPQSVPSVGPSLAARPPGSVQPNAASPAATTPAPESPAQVPAPTALRSARAMASTDETRRSHELERELAQLKQIREALNRDPAAALSGADAGHREFKGGVMHEEREALAVLALAKLDRAAFETRARRFLKAYPNSGFRERISSLLAARGAQTP